jgi:hypothetical protein
MMKRTILVLIGSVFLSSPLALAETSRTLAPGVTYISDTTASGREMRAVVVSTDSVGLRVESSGASCTGSFTGTEVRSLVAQNDVVAAINAHFFESNHVVKGDYVGNQTYLGGSGSSFYFAITTSGAYEAGSGRLTPERAAQYKMFIGGIYRIDSDSRSLTQMTDTEIATRFGQVYGSSPSNARDPIPRTLLGINTAEKKVILFAGGQGNRRSQTGVTPLEGINFLRHLGATQAFVLDSGSSTLMALNPRLAPGVADAPASGSVSDLLVVRTPPATGAPALVDCRNVTTSAPTASSDATPSSAAPTTTGGVGSSVAPPQQIVVPAGAVPLEAPIGAITSVAGNGESIIVAYTKILFTYAAGIAGALALLMLIVSGIQMIAGGADEITKAKERIVGVLSGLVLLGTGGYILYLVNPCFFAFGTTAACQARSTAYQNPSFTVTGTNQMITGQPGGPVVTAQPNRPRTPQQYASEKLSEARQRWTQYNADLTRVAGVVFPSAAPEALLGFASNGGVTELTPGESFQAMGMFGVETGVGSPAPVSGSQDKWIPLANDATVTSLLGRAGNIAPDGWKTAVTDQIAIGSVNLRNHGRGVMSALPASLRARSEGSSWFFAMACMGWSAGDGRAASIASALAGTLASVPEEQRWGALVRAYAEGGRAGSIRPVADSRGRFDTYANPFYSVVRTLQKMESGLALARDHSGNVAYFDDGLGSARTEAHQTITNLAYFGSVDGTLSAR